MESFSCKVKLYLKLNLQSDLLLCLHEFSVYVAVSDSKEQSLKSGFQAIVTIQEIMG